MQETSVIDRKSQIKEVAQALFRERGYAATSMRDLAKAVGIEPASLYSHITGKESLLREICFRMADEFFESIQGIDRTTDNLPEQLRQAIIAHLTVIWNNLDAASVFFHEWRYMEEPNLSRFKTMRREYEQLFRTMVTEGMEQDLFRSGNIRIIIPALFSSMNTAYDEARHANWLPPQEMGEEIWRLFVFGLKQPHHL